MAGHSFNDSKAGNKRYDVPYHWLGEGAGSACVDTFMAVMSGSDILQQGKCISVIGTV